MPGVSCPARVGRTLRLRQKAASIKAKCKFYKEQSFVFTIIRKRGEKNSLVREYRSGSWQMRRMAYYYFKK